MFCDFNTQSLALLLRREVPKIRTHQLLAEVLAKHLPDLEELHIAFHIAEYVAGSYEAEEEFERIRRLTLQLIGFIQRHDFAPEIRSIIISRRQFCTWAQGVSLRLIRPYAQPRIIDGLVYGEHWSFPAYLLRARPVHFLDLGYTHTIPLEDRELYFLTVLDTYPSPPDLTIQTNRADS